MFLLLANVDQWRPTKRDGDKTYSRDFLYQFKGHKSKPTNLLEIEGITVNLHLTSHMSGGGGGGGGGGARVCYALVPVLRKWPQIVVCGV